ncbi:hypothetical protein M9458_017156, partial [Cirrhinus mrigala]
RYCREKYMDLSTIDNMNNMNEINNVIKLIADTEHAWIGLQRTGHDKWQLSSGEPVLYLNWATGQPESSEE